MIYAFGDFELDTGLYQLRRHGQACDIEPQVFDLLKYLVENRDRVVTKSELFDAIWQGRIVSESTLTSRIKTARQAVGDSGARQELISTLRGRGFRFVGDVSARDASSTGLEADGADVQSHPPGAIQSERFGAEQSAARLPDKPSIAVLPFENMSRDPEQEYFADGMTEEVITLLSMVPGMLVIARNSTLAYKGQSVDVRTIAEELGVRYVLEGSVRKAGSRIRVTAQFVDAETGSHVWANHFDRDLGHIFAVQDEIAEGIVGALQARLLLAEAEVVKRATPHALDAWGNIINAKVRLFAYDREDVDEAEPFARRALEIDPDYGEAHAVLGHILAWRSYNGWCDDFKATARESISHGSRALTLAPNNAAVLADVGFARMWLGRPKEALPYLQRSINLNPNAALTCAQYGCALAIHGDTETGIEFCRRAFHLSPKDPMEYFFQFCLAAALQVQGNHVGAAEAAGLSIQLNPNNCWAYVVFASSCVRLGRIDEAKKAISQVTALSETAVPNIFRCWSEGTLWHVHADPILEVYDGPLPKRARAKKGSVK